MRATALLFAVTVWLLGCGPGRAEPEADADAARAFVAKTCAGCHPGTRLNAAVKRRLERGPLAEFLATHHVADPARREAVSAYLERTARLDPGAPSP